MAINPLQFFDVGRQAGAVGSAAYGPNFAITQMLDKAEKLGLVNAQTQGALNIAQTKANLEPSSKPFYTHGEEGLTYKGDVPSKAIVRSEGQPPSALDKLIEAQAANMFNQGQGGGQPPPTTTGGQPPPTTDGTGLDLGAMFQGIMSNFQRSDGGEAQPAPLAPPKANVTTPAQQPAAQQPAINPVDQALVDAIKQILEE